MRASSFLVLGLCAGAALLFQGCIPSEPAPKNQNGNGATTPVLELPLFPDTPDEAAGETIDGPPALVEEAPLEPGKSRVKMDLQPGINAGVRVSHIDNDGFLVEGQLGAGSPSKLTATIMPQADGGWLLDGAFTFATGGYSVGEPFTSFLDDRVLGSDNPAHIQQTNIFVITIPVSTPPADAIVTKAIETRPISLFIDAPKNVEFSVILISG